MRSSHLIPPPGLIYLDTAHTYPETLLELEQAWNLLAPGDFVLGDDFDNYWPPVQQSVIEFVQRVGAASFDRPALYTRSWPAVLRTSWTSALKWLRIAASLMFGKAHTSSRPVVRSGLLAQICSAGSVTSGRRRPSSCGTRREVGSCGVGSGG